MGLAGLEGKVVLITGGTDGIGFAAAQACGLAGARVVVASRRQINVDRAVALLMADGIQCLGLVAHAGARGSASRLVADTLAHFGRLDHLFINHAVSPGTMFMVRQADPSVPLCTEELWDKIFDTNVKSYWLLVREAVSHLRPGSSIVFNSSVGGYHPAPPLGPYGISKTALLGMVKALAAELGPDGIRVNAVAPGVIKTRFGGNFNGGEAVRSREDATSLKRLGEPREVGDFVAFLLSQGSSYMTGESLSISGGMSMGSRL